MAGPQVPNGACGLYFLFDKTVFMLYTTYEILNSVIWAVKRRSTGAVCTFSVLMQTRVLVDTLKALYIKAFSLFHGLINSRIPFGLPFTAFPTLISAYK